MKKIYFIKSEVEEFFKIEKANKQKQIDYYKNRTSNLNKIIYMSDSDKIFNKSFNKNLCVSEENDLRYLYDIEKQFKNFPFEDNITGLKLIDSLHVDDVYTFTPVCKERVGNNNFSIRLIKDNWSIHMSCSIIYKNIIFEFINDEISKSDGYEKHFYFAKIKDDKITLDIPLINYFDNLFNYEEKTQFYLQAANVLNGIPKNNIVNYNELSDKIKNILIFQ